jgi:multisubunit Na+/H+ antiporter MnhB subunit
VVRLAVPSTILVSLVIFFQGHNQPGGGFIAGVLAAAAGAMYLLGFGLERASRWAWWKVSVTGLLISIITGTLPLLFGRSFMDHTVWERHLWVVGHVHFPTATFFDLGVYLIVLGTLMTIFVELGQEGC